MPAPLSKNLRKRMIQAYLDGDTQAKIAREKSVSMSTVEKLLVLYRQTGSYEPRTSNSGRKPILSQDQLTSIHDNI
jgi:transposase